MSKNSLTLNAPAYYQMRATIYPSNTANKTIRWSSSNTNVATINGAGKIYAKNAGVTTITAKTSNGKYVTCKLMVNQDNVAISDASYILLSEDYQYALTTPSGNSFAKLKTQQYYGGASQIWNLRNIGGNAFVLRSNLNENKVVDIYHKDERLYASNEVDRTNNGYREGHAYLNPYEDKPADEWMATKLYDGSYIIKLKAYPTYKLTRGGNYDSNGNAIYLYSWPAWQQTKWKLRKV